jgi:poly-gamma-glutamate capsule biosynthesis protein CapA/YwtB (metallophosphatase superfamily)
MGQRRTGEVVVALSGDVMLGRLVNETIRERGFAHPWGDILPVIKDSDAFLINLECALTSHAQHWTNGEEKAFYFRADPAVVRTLQIARVDFVSLANNHASDFETEGLLETVRVLDGAGIAHAGAGPDLAGASRPATIKANSYRIAVIAYTDYPVAWAAEPSRPGVNYTKVSTHPKHMGKISDAITAARGLADLVIFTIHWGPNMVSRPSAEFRDFARAVIDAGADVFWGHSAHVVHGIEIWRGRPILYDTGDFVDDYATDRYLRNDLSALFLLHARPPAIEGIELIPVKIDHMRVSKAKGAERDWFVNRFRGLCAEMNTPVRVTDERLAIDLQPSRAAAGSK